MSGEAIGFLMHEPDNPFGQAEVQQNREFLSCYLLATYGLDFQYLNISALVKEFAAQSGRYSELRMNNIVGGCFLLHHYLPQLKALAMDLWHVDYDMLRTIWNGLIVVPLNSSPKIWNAIDAFLVSELSPSRPHQALPTCRHIAAALKDELVRLGVYEDFEEDNSPEASQAKLESMFGVELWDSPHPGVSVLNVTMPSDCALEAKQSIEAAAKAQHKRQDEILLARVCGEQDERDEKCEIRLLGFGELTPAVEVTPVSLHGVGRLTEAQRIRIQARQIQYDNILAVADICRGPHDPTPAQRALVKLRDGTCRFPGCNVDARFCEVDHVINWEVGGWTTISNLQCLCPHHHNFKTDRHAKAHSDSFGNITWEFATGTTVTTVPKGILAGKVQGRADGITTRHDHPTKTDEDYLQPPIRDGFGRWGTTLTRYREKQRERYLARNHLKVNISTSLPEEPPPEGFEPPPDDQYPQG